MIKIRSLISAYLHFLLSALVKIDLLIVRSHLPVDLLCLLAEASTLLVSQLLQFSVSLQLKQQQLLYTGTLQSLNRQGNQVQLNFRAKLQRSVAKLLNTRMKSLASHQTRKYALI